MFRKLQEYALVVLMAVALFCDMCRVFSAVYRRLDEDRLLSGLFLLHRSLKFVYILWKYDLLSSFARPLSAFFLAILSSRRSATLSDNSLMALAMTSM